MKYAIIWIIMMVLISPKINAQQFIDKGSIEFEVITNVKKTFPDLSYLADIKESMPTFKTAFYKYTFANNKSIYKFDS